MCEQDGKLCRHSLSLPFAFVSLTPVSDRRYPMHRVFCPAAFAVSADHCHTKQVLRVQGHATLPYNQADPSLKTITNSNEGTGRQIGDPS